MPSYKSRGSAEGMAGGSAIAVVCALSGIHQNRYAAAAAPVSASTASPSNRQRERRTKLPREVRNQVRNREVRGQESGISGQESDVGAILRTGDPLNY